jgi:hypothetical protein
MLDASLWMLDEIKMLLVFIKHPETSIASPQAG